MLGKDRNHHIEHIMGHLEQIKRHQAHIKRHQEQIRRTRERHRKRASEHELQRPPLKWVVFGIAMMNLAIALSWGLSYWLMGFIYRTWFQDAGHPLLKQYLTVVLGMFILFTAISLAKFVFKPLRNNLNIFIQLSQAMQRMAKGDFNVNVDVDKHFPGQFRPLVNSFNAMATELGQMEQVRQEFISNVSHEIQSPLTSINGFARALKNDELSPETRNHYLDIIETESMRLSRLSDNLMKLTSLESKHHPFETKPYRLDRQLRHILLACEPQWQQKQLDMDIELPECTIEGDEELLSQVWTNLFYNAIKFTPEKGTIKLHLLPEGKQYRIVVSDNGPGIADEHLPHLFERFYKVDKSRNRSGSGSGLGLSIVRKIVEMHGGEVSVSSRVGEGTSFTVVLPVLHLSETDANGFTSSLEED
jgi:two-component system, OmpR family, phosphate regulon sensor histidine kinase PhoR